MPDRLPNCYRCGCQPCACADGVTLLQGDNRTIMQTLPERHYQMCVTSPPYFALRSYLPADHPDKALEIGSETSIEAFVTVMVEVFRGVKRVLRDDGVLFLNLGDSYAAGKTGRADGERNAVDGFTGGQKGKGEPFIQRKPPLGLKPKDLCGIPWRVALALQADGWYLRDAIVWHKPSPMPGSQRDRCTSSYEFIFQLTKRPRYYWDMESIKEEGVPSGWNRQRELGSGAGCKVYGASHDASITMRNDGERVLPPTSTRIPRNVWTIASEGFPGAHFATYPRELASRCIRAATSEKGCCPECGAPWVRVTDSKRVRTRPGINTKCDAKTWNKDSLGNIPGRLDGNVIGNRDPGRHVTATRTVGWRPGCECVFYGLRDNVPEAIIDELRSLNLIP